MLVPDLMHDKQYQIMLCYNGNYGMLAMHMLGAQARQRYLLVVVLWHLASYVPIWHCGIDSNKVIPCNLIICWRLCTLAYQVELCTEMGN